MTLDSTVGGSSANSYGKVEDADSYFTDRFYDSGSWAGATDPEKSGSLMTATSLIERLDFVGSVVTNDQALKWPRANVQATNDLNFEATDVIPTRILHSMFLLAVMLIKKNIEMTPLNTHLEGAWSVGGASFSPDESGVLTEWPDTVWYLIGDLVVGTNEVIRQ